MSTGNNKDLEPENEEEEAEEEEEGGGENDEDEEKQDEEKQDDTQISEISKDKLLKLFDNKSADITLVAQTNSKSAAWRSFKRVFLKGTATNYVKCNSCKVILKQDRKTGTSSMKNHKCNNASASSLTQKSIMPFTKKNIPLKEKQDMTTLCAQWCATNYRPFSVVEDEGFESIARKCFQLGHKYGPTTPFKDIFPVATTVSRYVEKVAGELRGDFKEAMEKVRD